MAANGALPVVDLAPFLAGDDDKAGGVARATEAVHEACKTHGFFRAVNHGVPPELMARALQLTATFFTLPDEDKDKARPIEGSEAPLPAGYGRHPVNSIDKNEYVIMCDPKLGFNVYPTNPSGFREAVEECFAKLTELGLLVHDILNECMGLPAGFLKDFSGDRSFDFMAALRYFPATEEENSGLSAHEDGSCISFVIQDGVGGLEVLKDGNWVPAEPVDGSIIVNIGDVIQVLSNNKLKSATHRVVRKPVHRHSLAFFFNIRGDKWIEPLPEFTAKVGEAPRYRGFMYKEYQQRRLRDKTHPPSRPEDVHGIQRRCARSPWWTWRLSSPATRAVREACRTHGFFHAVNHGVPAELLAAFFALPGEEKTKLHRSPSAVLTVSGPSLAVAVVIHATHADNSDRVAYKSSPPVSSHSCDQPGATTEAMAAIGALPVVDLAPFLAGDDDKAAGGAARATEAVREACRTHGFFRVVNHGVPTELMARALQLSAAFFSLPDEDKAKARPAEGAEAPLPAGYARQPANSADKNEYVMVFDPKLGFNVYPAEPAGFRSVETQIRTPT
ncbi:hypothetical protein HU200_057756 [Digitaria exilis]|uniref:Fe2OG dioxygenase domain-containing protein n=1 Tax=Digitaria exilis TaxID=1010633 RepID=A0A835E3V7_9POAL|nr:hypothetical protein HU200_057756 [Digitaria exilis]